MKSVKGYYHRRTGWTAGALEACVLQIMDKPFAAEHAVEIPSRRPSGYRQQNRQV